MRPNLAYKNMIKEEQSTMKFSNKSSFKMGEYYLNQMDISAPNEDHLEKLDQLLDQEEK